MIFYHGTTKENWDKIQQEGVLWGRRYFTDKGVKKEVDRCTYLAVDKEEAEQYGEIVLQVEYDPHSSKHNNYIEGCWQVRVYEPISIDSIKQI